MSQETFERFRQLVLTDLALQDQLREVTDPKAFRALLQDLGRERGLDFAEADIIRAEAVWRRAWIERWISG